MFRILKNLIKSNWGWSFTGRKFGVTRKVLYEGETLKLKAQVQNDGVRLGTVYVRFLIADAYDLRRPTFDSDKDLSSNERRALRLVDIPPFKTREVTCSFSISNGTMGRPFDIKLQLWNPHKLFNGPAPWLFYDTGWIGGFEIVSTPTCVNPLTVFISYSWSSVSHKEWVKELAEELRKYSIDVIVDWKDLHPGEEVTLFMERGITESKVTLLICDNEYVSKANERKAGVGFETILSSHEYLLRSPDERSRMIAVIRNNTLPNYRKLPRYLGSSIYVDMNGSNWQAGPMLELVDAIRRHS